MRQWRMRCAHARSADAATPAVGPFETVCGLNGCVQGEARDEVARRGGYSRARHLPAETRAGWIPLLWGTAELSRTFECSWGADDTRGARGAVVLKFWAWPTRVVVTKVTAKHQH